jgi:SAM-dependent methyltransferase
VSQPVPPRRNDEAPEPGEPGEPGEPDFSAAPLLEVIAYAQARLATGARQFSFTIADPDLGHGHYAGEPIEVGAAGHDAPALTRVLHRPWRVWIELADRLDLRMRTPRPAGAPRLRLAFERLAPSARWQDEASGDRTKAPATAATCADPPGGPDGSDRTERYGARSGYARISKAEEPGFVLDLAEALARCAVPPAARVLDLGCNDGDELALMMALAPRLAAASFVGIDHSASALEVARRRFAELPEGRVQLVCADLNDLAAHALGRFDLVVSFGTLQSPGVDDRALLRQLVQHHLAPRGAIILGVPNCRYLDGELSHGARMRNFRQPELGLVVKDLAFYRKYLQQHDRQVFLTGHHTLLLTAVGR